MTAQIPRLNPVEGIVQSWWLASTRMHDCAGDRLTLDVVSDSLRYLRRNTVNENVALRANAALVRLHTGHAAERRVP
jgi:hypothetical protein